MKRLKFKRWLLTALASMTVFSAPAAKKTFTAVASNVDGLPPTVHINYTVGSRDVSMNADGSQEPGATRMGQLIAENLWDIVALSEDFNYHNYIMEGVSTYYNASKWRGLIDQSNLNGNLINYPSATPTDSKGLYMKTDGLCFLSRKKYQVTPGTNDEGENKNWIPWNDHYGFTDHEADGLIRKGFRFYQVTLGEGLVVDVYITHMEAGSEPEDNAARAKQLTQFAEYIKAHKGKNPIIILGDTNCRYTRDPLKAGFIDLIEQDTDLDVQDPWVQHMWGGDYPEPNSPSLMVGTLGEQKGEVVDKIWYINNKQSKCTLTCTGYLHDDSFTYADGSQIADHYPVVGTFVIENPEAPEPSTGEVVIPDAPAKGAIVSGQTYYIRNLGSGEFLRAGGSYTTQAVLGDYPSKVIPTSKGGNGYSLKTTHDNKWISKDVNGGPDYYMDQAENTWTLTQIKDNVYTMFDSKGNAVGHNNGVLATVTANSSDANQQWEFLTQADLLHELYYASSATPKDVTFLMKAPDFGYADQESWTNSKGNNASHGKERPTGVEHVSFWKAYNAAASGIFGNSSGRNWNLSQEISDLPAGTYVVTYQVAAYNLNDNHGFKINGNNAPFTDLGSSDPGSATVAKNLAAGMYTHSVTVPVDANGKISITVEKDATKSATGAYYDNFKIKCIGLDGIPDLSMYERVKVAIDDAQAKADAAGLNNYRNNQVVELWKEQEITGDGWTEIKKTYKNLGEAVLANKEVGADYTYAIVNPSFELYPDYKDSRYTIDGGYPFGWSYPTSYAKDSGVWPASGGNKNTGGADGNYLFNTYDANFGGNAVYQEVTLTPGIYKLQAKVASDKDNKVYLFAGDKTNAKTITGDKNTFEEAVLFFPVSDGKPFNLGVTGGDGNGNFAMTGGRWYKADDFRLTRMGGVETIQGMAMLQLAINEVTSRLNTKSWMDTESRNKLNEYQAMIDNYTLVGDGTKEFQEVYDIIRAKVYAQTGTGEIDYTYALANPSFEWGNTYGWDLLSKAGDTDAKENSNSTYTMSSCDGSYVFNTWQDGRGTIISQTIPNLPAGHYVLQATFANDPNNYVYLQAAGEYADNVQREMFQCVSDKDKGEVKIFEFDVPADAPYITISAGGCNSDATWDDFGGAWYKVDNFKLKRTGDAQICFFYKRLRDAINEANSVAAELPKYYSNQWDASDYQKYIDEHQKDEHDIDNGHTSNMYDPLNGGSGIQEINDLFSDLRTLIFSQQESGADMSGAITNNSFELGDLTGWTTYMDPNADAKVTIGNEGGTYGTEKVDGKYLYNAYMGDRTAHPIYQVIPNMPSGRYTLTVKIASDAGAKFFLGANAKHSDIIYIPSSGVEGVADEAMFHEYSFTFEVPVEAESKDVKIGVYPTTASSSDEINESHFADDAIGPWYKVDHFRLTLESRYLEVDWKMETPTHGTIMLPFDVSAEELAKQNLEAYSIKFSEKSNTPSDIDVNNYRILNWVDPHDGKDGNQDGIKAYNPYVLKNIAPVEEAESASVKSAKLDVKAAEGETNDDPQANYTGAYYKFSGYTQYKATDPDDENSGTVNEADNKSGTLTGTLVDVPAGADQHHLTQLDEESSVGFMSHKEHGSDDEIIPAYHAYMLNPKEELRSYDGFYFYEPLQKIELVMEAGKFGTLILPFEAELPEGLKAYTLTGVGEIRNYDLGDAQSKTFQLLEKEEVAANAEGKVILEENVPYLIEDPTYEGNPYEDESREVITFAGQANNVDGDGNGLKANSPEGNLLTGLFVSRDKINDEYLESGHWVLYYDEENDRPVFGKLDGATEFKAYNAYIAMPAAAESAAIKAVSTQADEVLTPQADEILVDEPEQTASWTIDNQYVGTIVMPFDVDASVLTANDLEAYEVISAGTEQTKKGVTYHVINSTAVTEGLDANKAYMVIPTGEVPAIKFQGMAGDMTPEQTGLMLGTYSAISAPENSYVANDEKGMEFKKVGEEGAAVAAFHAYIPAKSDLSGTYLVIKDETVDVTEIMEGDEDVDIYTLNGVVVRRGVKVTEALEELDRGIYILRSAKGTVKVIK